MRIGFKPPTYYSRSGNIDYLGCVNFIPELIPDGKGFVSLFGAPGTKLFANFGSNVIRGAHVFNGLIYVVEGNQLYSVNGSGVISDPLGTLNTSSGRVEMKDNGLASSSIGGNQLMIVDEGYGYIYDVSTDTFSLISGGGWPSSNASNLTYLDGYFIVSVRGGMSFYVSDLYDGTTWNALATSPVSASSDPIMALHDIHQQLWIIKENTSEVWYDAGIPTSQGSPFLRISGGVIDYGTYAKWSVARGDNTLFMLGSQRNNDMGQLVGVVRIVGYQAQVISPVAFNYKMRQFSTVADAYGYCYSDEGHTYYVLTFPSGNWTIVYDCSTNLWHERSSYSSPPYQINRHVGNCYIHYNGKHYVADYRDGKVYEMASTYYDDAGQPLVSIAHFRLSDKEKAGNFSIRRLFIDAETGVGVTSVDFTPAINIDSPGEDIGFVEDVPTVLTDEDDPAAPVAYLSWSDDRGHKWSSDYESSMGKAGEYNKRLLWRKLGYSPGDRIFRLQVSDSVKRVLAAAYIE